MITKMVLDGILFSEDAETLSTMDGVLDSFAIHTKVALSLKEAVALLEQQVFDIVFIDYKDKRAASSVVHAVHNSRLNRQAWMMAITDEGAAIQLAFAEGVQLSMPRVSSVDQGVRYLRPSYAFMSKRLREPSPLSALNPGQISTSRSKR